MKIKIKGGRKRFKAGNGVDMKHADANSLVSVNPNLQLTSLTVSGSISAGGDIVAAAGFTGNLTGDVTGNLTGNVTGDVTGNLTGDVTGNVTGDITGDLTGNVTGNVTGDVTGDVTGNLTGLVDGIDVGDLESRVSALEVLLSGYADTSVDVCNAGTPDTITVLAK